MNRNVRDASMLFDELARAGLRHVCLSPGSRNTPLVFAAARHAGLTVTSHLDERSAAFFALGIGVATGMPAALVCTSGSAAANYFPAIVEAHQARAPLIVITADRPHELRHSGANQTMKQPDLFGGYALWSVDLALPEAQPSPLVLRNLRATANRAVAVARGSNGSRSGVVHINAPFRPPLEPTPVATDATDTAAAARDTLPHVTIAPDARLVPEPATLHRIAALIDAHPRGLIVCGPDCARGGFAAAVVVLAERAGYPLLADGTSGVRFGVPGVIGGYDTFLNGAHGLPAPELVLRFGNVPTSKWLNQYLDLSAPAHVVQIAHDGVWADDTHRLSDFVHADPETVAQALSHAIGGAPRDPAWLAGWRAKENATWAALDRGLGSGAWFDAIAVHDALALAPDDAAIYAGNSLPVRHLDQFGRPGAKRLFAHANRGVSGIDGNVSTALGIGHARRDKRLILLIGDITLYHDMNGLLAIRRCDVPVTIVLLNNNGGGIFQRLPVNQFDPEFTEHFVTPHDLDYAHVAALYGLRHVRPRTRAEFHAALNSSFADASRSFLIEVQTDAKVDLAARKQLFTVSS
jgi:2-succinyl-5-enolpyruvyl-6-hydroxy-3-cyclohexene-1-carboxylate synthase